MKPPARKVAVIGSGIAGMTVARALAPHAHVTLFESESWFGGHAHTVDVHLEGVTHGVDTGFLVYNDHTYPGLIRLFDELGIDSAASDMSFSVQAPARRWEWCGSDLGSVFAQRRNLVSPAFWSMLADIVRFNRRATALALAGGQALDEPVGDFLDRHRFGVPFRDGYLLPMLACIWSCPTDQMLRFPVGTLVRFCHNHGLLRLTDRPQWRTVRGGSQHYVRRMLEAVTDKRLACPVHAVRPIAPGSGRAGVEVSSARGTERFDDVVLATHSDQALALLPQASAEERAVLGAIGYRPNRVVLHTDATMLPRRPRAWAAWNYEAAANPDDERAGVCLHYLINRLQPLPWKTPVVVSMNPLRAPRDVFVLGEWTYWHPVFDLAAVRAQAQLPQLQGRSGVWYCGAWARYGFHEDGLQSGLAVVDALQRAWAETPALRAAA